MNKLSRWFTLAVLALRLTGCVNASPAASVADTHWSLVSINGQAPIAGRALTLNFQSGGQLAGDSGCNGYSGRYQITGAKISVDQLVSTLRACAEQPLNNQESVFQKALGHAAQFGLAGDRLTLKNASGGEELIFQKQ